ncbi:MAG: peptidoglycan-associated lipoprotein Pal [Candidatus Binatia bacterium]
MANRLSTALYGLMLFAFLALAGCPSPATTKPEVSSAPPGPQAAAREKATKEKTAKETKAPTSLEALRRGEAPIGGPLKEIFYDFDRYDLRPDARATLKANADWLKANPSARVEIEGHADERGTNEYNLALGAKRAQAAKDYLATLGIVVGRLSTISYGEEIPVCREKTEDCWQRNRRARFVVTTPRPGA